MKLYWIRAQAPRRALAVAKYLGLELECIELVGGAQRSADYAALNPNRKAPTLVDGDMVLWESSAIMAYLSIKAGSDLWPANAPAAQVDVLRWLSWNDNHWSPVVSPFYFEHIVKATFHIAPPDRDALRAHVDDFKRVAAILDDHLATRTHPACGRLTIADFQLASMAADWRDAEMPLESFPNIVRWLDMLQRIPAWADPWPAA